MIENFREIENGYIENFSKKDVKENHIIFTDHKLPDMYCFNFILAKDNINEDSIEDFVKEQFNIANAENKDFLRIILHPNLKITDNLRENLTSMGFNLDTNLYMKLKDNNMDMFKVNKDCTVKRAEYDTEFDAGEKLDIETSILADMPTEFCERKASRKKEAYMDKDNNLSLYLCSYKDKNVGKCELHIQGEYAKMEDFDILEGYQRKGLGTSMLYKMISDSLSLGAKHIYLIAEKDDTPKDMYKKLGFEVIGEETVLFWSK